jgi:ribosomal protein L11
MVSKLRFLLPLSAMIILGACYNYTASADSTISIPVPESIKDKQVTISLRIPPNTQPLNRKQKRPKLSSRKSLIVWHSNPSPKLKNNDEFHSIVRTFKKKGWIKSNTIREITRMRPLDKYYAVRVLQHIAGSVIEIGQARNFTRVIRKCNLTPSDIQDLRRMIKRFEKNLVIFGANPRKLDKDLLLLQERFKKSRQGILKVLRVEGADDGSTIIHLSVD